MIDRLSMFSLAPIATKLDNGQTVYLKRLTALERVQWLESITESESGKSFSESLNTAATMISLTLCDEQGKRLFGDDELELVKKIDAQTLDRLSTEALSLNGMGNNDELKKKSINTEPITVS